MTLDLYFYVFPLWLTLYEFFFSTKVTVYLSGSDNNIHLGFLWLKYYEIIGSDRNADVDPKINVFCTFPL